MKISFQFLAICKRNAENSFFLHRLNRDYESASLLMSQFEKEIGESPEKLIVFRGI